MTKTIDVVVRVLFSVSLVACSGTRVVRETKTGGEIALLGGREEAMEKAQGIMARKCGGPGTYEILEQGEVPVGETSTTQNNSTTAPGKSWTGNPVSQTSGSSTTQTQQKTEWRVTYQCRGTQPPPAAAPAAPASSAPGPSSATHSLSMYF